MIKQILFSSTLMVLVISCSSKKEKQNCEVFKQGKFYFRGQLSKAEYFVERTDSMQIETDSSNRIIFRKKIKWLNDCEYELKFISGQSMDTLPDGSVHIVEAENNIQRVKIISPAADHYIFEISGKDEKPYRDTMWLQK